jgi:hypothetical protein
MNSSYLAFLFCFTGLLFAQDHLSSRNGLGWDNGISYRRYLRDDLWLGFAISGDVRSEKQNDTTIATTHYLANDSTYSLYSYDPDTTSYYSGTIKIELGKRIFHYNVIELNTDIFGSYTYQNSKSCRSGTSPYYNSSPRNIISGGIGLEPMVWIAKSLSIGMDFGIQYSYTFGKDKSDLARYYTNESYRNSSSGTFSSHEIRSFGSFSLSTGLIGFVWF